MRWMLLLFLCVPSVVHAACNLGYHLENGQCVRCPMPYYCPDENTMVECPKDATDWRAVFTAQGLEITSITEPRYISWIGEYDIGPHKIENCYIDIGVVTPGGKFLYEPNFKNGEYIKYETKLWYSASPGYYLSSYNWTSTYDWYHDVKTCTNLPANAHYTGPGTPDAQDGSVVDANDCPWECDAGYGRHNDECVPLCTSLRHIKTDTGLSFNLYPVAYSSPRLAVEHNGVVCYGVLAPGRAGNTINVEYKGAIYHVEN